MDSFESVRSRRDLIRRVVVLLITSSCIHNYWILKFFNEPKPMAAHGELPLISVGIPVCNGLDTVEAAVMSVMNQTYPNIELVVSIDRCDDASATRTLLESLQNRAGTTIRIVEHRDRLGWVNNSNFLLQEAQGMYAAILPHDDMVPPTYYAALQFCLEGNPSAVNCFPYINCIHDPPNASGCRKLSLKSMQGGIHDRLVTAVSVDLGIPYRGLIRRDDVSQDFSPFHLVEAGVNSDFYLTDLTQIVQFAAKGELIAIDVPYYKTIHGASTASKQLRTMSVVDQQLSVIDFVANSWKVAQSHVPAHSKALYNETITKLDKYEAPLISLGQRENTTHLTKHQVRVIFHQRRFDRLANGAAARDFFLSLSCDANCSGERRPLEPI